MKSWGTNKNAPLKPGWGNSSSKPVGTQSFGFGSGMAAGFNSKQKNMKQAAEWTKVTPSMGAFSGEQVKANDKKTVPLSSSDYSTTAQAFMTLPYEECTEAKVKEFLETFSDIPIIKEIQKRIAEKQAAENEVDYEEKYYELKDKLEEIYKISGNDEEFNENQKPETQEKNE